MNPNSTSTPIATIIVPCRNERKHIDEFLRGLLAQEPIRGEESDWEAIVADGLSDDGTRERIDEVSLSDSRLRRIDNPAKTVSTGLNLAIGAARGSVIIRMDVHTEYASDYVKQCVLTLEATGAANVGGPARTKAEGYWQRANASAYHSPFSVGGARFHNVDYEGPLDTVVYGCWLKSTLEQVGGFDEELVRNQDDELNFRLTQAGLTLWQTPKIQSWYHPRASISALFQQYKQYGYWKVRVIQKHRRPASLRHLGPSIFVLGGGLGWLACLVWPILWLVYGGAWTLYFILSALFSLKAASRDGWDLLPVLPLMFLTYHISYGWGFLLGLIDFILLKKGPRSDMARLSRSSKT